MGHPAPPRSLSGLRPHSFQLLGTNTCEPSRPPGSAGQPRPASPPHLHSLTNPPRTPNPQAPPRNSLDVAHHRANAQEEKLAPSSGKTGSQRRRGGEANCGAGLWAGEILLPDSIFCLVAYSIFGWMNLHNIFKIYVYTYIYVYVYIYIVSCM